MPACSRRHFSPRAGLLRLLCRPLFYRLRNTIFSGLLREAARIAEVESACEVVLEPL